LYAQRRKFAMLDMVMKKSDDTVIAEFPMLRQGPAYLAARHIGERAMRREAVCPDALTPAASARTVK
jgi:hypothetical protein